MTALSSASGVRRLVLIANSARDLADQRSPLIAEAVRRRHKVLCLVGASDDVARAMLEQAGAAVEVVAFQPKGFNPFAAYGVRRSLVAILAAFEPHTLAVGDSDLLKLATVTAARAKVPHVVAMLSSVPAENDVLKSVSAIVTDTNEQRRAFEASKQLAPACRIFVAPTAGIDLRTQPAIPLAHLDAGFRFLLVTRPSDASARTVFTEASLRVTAVAPATRFLTLPADVSPSTIASEIAACHVAVHAGSGEGLEAGLLPALAAGRPIITTDVLGSRDTVDERVNGCRFPPGDAKALADAMLSCLKRTDLIVAMSRASRIKAERRFDVQAINNITLAALGLDASLAAAA